MREVCTKLLVIGIDGASAPVVARMRAQGRLPHLDSLAINQDDGALITPFPPHTAPGWASIFTGVGPGEHGVYQFWQLQAPSYYPPLTTVADFAREPLWRTLERHGLSVGLYQVPMSHPPAPIRNGYMLTWPLSPTLQYIWPKPLLKELADRGLHYQSDLVTMYRDGAGYLDWALGTIDLKARTIAYLMAAHPTDVLLAVFTEVDRVSHYFWGSEAQPSAAVESVYEAIDGAVGRLLAAVPDDCAVVVVSDHGFGLCRRNVHVNVLLEEAGLLRTMPTEPVSQAAPNDAFLGDAAAAASGASWFTAARPARTVDWARTRAFMPAPGCFGINLNRAGRQAAGRDARDADSVIADVTACIERLRYEGEQLFDVVPREAVYRGQRLSQAPDLMLLPRRWDIMPVPDIAGPLWSPPSQAGIHRTEGIFLTSGIARRPTGPVRAEDVAPTCLHALGLPVQCDLDGAALGPGAVAFEPPQRVRASSAARPGAAAQALVEQRLAQMGYL